VRKTLSVGGADPRPSLVLLIATPQSDAAAENARRRRPLDFSMAGLAGYAREKTPWPRQQSDSGGL
jgi:hypothetical protein